MLDIGWQELFFIAVIALIVVGPKDLPKALGTIAKYYRRAKELAGEFQSGVTEMVREAELDELKRKVEKAGKFDFDPEVKAAIDPTGSLSEDFDPAEFERDLKQAVEGGPPQRNRAQEMPTENSDHSSGSGADDDQRKTASAGPQPDGDGVNSGPETKTGKVRT
jgi:sec-independent protein translocase protein TatB